MRCFQITTLLLLTALCSMAMDPPAMLWEKWFYPDHDGAMFFDIELTSDGYLFITGSVYDYTVPLEDGYSAFLFNTDGDLQWKVHHPWYTGRGLDGTILQDGSFAITGRCVETPDSTYSLFIMKISHTGSIEWAKIYDYPETREEGYGITCLPDGGFAVCGRVHGTGTMTGKAWLLRTDAQGDTLWTAVWGTDIANYGKEVVFSNNELCVLALGESDSLSESDVHLLFYDLEGNYLRGTDYPELYWHFPAGLCTSFDGGYTFAVDLSVIWHTDQYGETLWWHNINSYGQDELFDITRTMDNGYILCGWCGKEPDPSQRNDCTQIPAAETDTGWTEDAWLVKFDEEGNQQWEFKREAQVTHCHYYSVVQLPEGGYMACGQWGGDGYLARFAPEAGIAEPDPAGSLRLDVFPNPCSSVLSVRFSMAESSSASISIYDLYGRLVDTVTDEVFPGGENTVEWTVPEDISSGCYLIQLSGEENSVTENCVLLR